MNVQIWTFVMVGLSFTLYIGVAIWSKARSTGDFYIAGSNVHPVVNGMATAADWMSAASFISMAGMIAFLGRDGSVYLLGWTGGYVLLALLLAPYLRKFGKYTVPDFVGDRYYSQLARIVAVVCAVFVSFTYVAGTDAWCRNCLLAVPKRKCYRWCADWNGNSFLLCSPWWDEGDYLYTSCTVLCSHLCLHGSSNFHFHISYEQSYSTTRFRSS